MMTDPMKPLGLSLWQLIAAGPMIKAGDRLFVDVAHMLASPDSREILLNNMGQHDPLIKDALMTIIERLTPPRVITSEGEIVAGEYKRENIPAEAIVGLSVSSGVI